LERDLNKIELELSSEQRKNQNLVEKKSKLDRVITMNKNEIASTKDKIKDDTSKTKMEMTNAKKMVGDMKMKIEMMEKELKRKDRIIEKINERIRDIIDKKVGLGRNLDDWDYRRYENRIDVVSRITKEAKDEDNQYQYIPERELIDLQKKGFEDNHTELLYENDMLRACIVRLQSELNNFMVEVIENIRELDADTKILNHLAFDKYKMLKIDPNMLELPHIINGDKVKTV
jgi:chromosome segregation ATPase